MLFSWATGGGQRFEVLPLGGVSPYLAGNIGKRLYVSYPGMSGAFFSTRRHWPNNTSISGGAGYRITRVSLKTGEPIVQQAESWPITSTTVNLGTLATPTTIGFQCRAYDATQILTGETLRRVTIWPAKMPNTKLRELSQITPKWPVHLLGDSFLNQQHITNELYKEIRDGGNAFVPVTQDGVGGSSLQQQAARLALTSVTESGVVFDTSQYRNATLVIMDGGLDYAPVDPGTVQGREDFNAAALNSMISTISHDRWLYLGAAPNTDLGTQGRTDWDAMQDFMRSICGDHFVETLPYLQSLSDGSATDIDLVSRGLWPTSTRVSDTDFHPNAKGQAALAFLIDQALRQRGWLVA